MVHCDSPSCPSFIGHVFHTGSFPFFRFLPSNMVCPAHFLPSSCRSFLPAYRFYLPNPHLGSTHDFVVSLLPIVISARHDAPRSLSFRSISSLVRCLALCSVSFVFHSPCTSTFHFPVVFYSQEAHNRSRFPVSPRSPLFALTFSIQCFPRSLDRNVRLLLHPTYPRVWVEQECSRPLRLTMGVCRTSRK